MWSDSDAAVDVADGDVDGDAGYALFGLSVGMRCRLCLGDDLMSGLIGWACSGPTGLGLVSWDGCGFGRACQC